MSLLTVIGLVCVLVMCILLVFRRPTSHTPGHVHRTLADNPLMVPSILESFSFVEFDKTLNVQYIGDLLLTYVALSRDPQTRLMSGLVATYKAVSEKLPPNEALNKLTIYRSLIGLQTASKNIDDYYAQLVRQEAGVQEARLVDNQKIIYRAPVLGIWLAYLKRNALQTSSTDEANRKLIMPYLTTDETLYKNPETEQPEAPNGVYYSHALDEVSVCASGAPRGLVDSVLYMELAHHALKRYPEARGFRTICGLLFQRLAGVFCGPYVQMRGSGDEGFNDLLLKARVLKALMYAYQTNSTWHIGREFHEQLAKVPMNLRVLPFDSGTLEAYPKTDYVNIGNRHSELEAFYTLRRGRMLWEFAYCPTKELAEKLPMAKGYTNYGCNFSLTRSEVFAELSLPSQYQASDKPDTHSPTTATCLPLNNDLHYVCQYNGKTMEDAFVMRGFVHLGLGFYRYTAHHPASTINLTVFGWTCSEKPLATKVSATEYLVYEPGHTFRIQSTTVPLFEKVLPVKPNTYYVYFVATLEADKTETFTVTHNNVDKYKEINAFIVPSVKSGVPAGALINGKPDDKTHNLTTIDHDAHYYVVSETPTRDTKLETMTYRDVVQAFSTDAFQRHVKFPKPDNDDKDEPMADEPGPEEPPVVEPPPPPEEEAEEDAEEEAKEEVPPEDSEM